MEQNSHFTTLPENICLLTTDSFLLLYPVVCWLATYFFWIPSWFGSRIILRSTRIHFIMIRRSLRSNLSMQVSKQKVKCFGCKHLRSLKYAFINRENMYPSPDLCWDWILYQTLCLKGRQQKTFCCCIWELLVKKKKSTLVCLLLVLTRRQNRTKQNKLPPL